MEYIKNIGRRKHQRGATSHRRGWRACPIPWARALPHGPPASWAPWQAPDAHLLLYGVFCPGKNRREAFRTKHHRLEAEPGQNQSRALAELFCRGNIHSGGGNRSHRHDQRSSHREGVNLHQHLHQHHILSNPSSSLVFDLGPKTSDWYLCVANSVDYSL